MTCFCIVGFSALLKEFFAGFLVLWVLYLQLLAKPEGLLRIYSSPLVLFAIVVGNSGILVRANNIWMLLSEEFLEYC